MDNIPKLWRKIGRYVLSTSINILSIFVYIFKYQKFKLVSNIKGFMNYKPEIGDDYMTIFKRLSDAYIKAKKDERSYNSIYQPSYMWKKIINDRFRDLIDSIRNNNLIKLQALLENFHRERFSIGCGGSGDDYYEMEISSLYKYQFVNAWCKAYFLYKEKVGNNHLLTYPQVGNPLGLYHNGQVIPVDAIRYHYYAIEILSLLRDVNNPVICEIGGGLGGQAYAVLSQGSNKHITYIIIDLPEVLIISTYFLMVSFPEKKFLLYGEEETMNLRDKLDRYDIILMPTFVLPQLGDKTVDLFFNSFSFSEMNEITVKEYLLQIERICRIYFMHVNHSAKFVWYENGKKFVNLPANEVIPDPERFKKIYQRNHRFGRLKFILLEFYLRRTKPFVFLYKRIK